MPTYQNQTASPITFNGETWAPSETKAVNFFAYPGVGLTQTDEAPRVVSQVLASGELVFTDENDPPVRIDIGDCDAFLGSFVVKSGGIELRKNYDDDIPIKVTTTTKFRVVAKRIDIEAIHIKPLSETSLVFNISRAK